MICPKCGNKMTLGKINFAYGYSYMGGGVPYWAEKNYFIRETFPNAKDAEKKGVGFAVKFSNEMINVAYTNLPDAYACKECKVILLECDERGLK